MILALKSTKDYKFDTRKRFALHLQKVSCFRVNEHSEVK